MKSDTIRRAIGGIDDDIIEEADKSMRPKANKTLWIKWGMAAVFILLLTGAIVVSRMLKPGDAITEIHEQAGDPADTAPVTATLIESEKNVIWANDVNHPYEEGFRQWGRFDLVSYGLYGALENAKDDDVLAILARPAIDYGFVFEGKTLAEYYSRMCSERNRPELLAELRKEGDSLKYKEALYTTGTPTGERWDRSFYEERIQYYGSDLLAKYLVDGAFLKEQLEQDLQEALNAVTETNAYNEALGAYLDRLASSVPGSLPAKALPKENGIVLFLTKKGFASLDTVDTSDWTFALAVKDGDTVQYGDEE